MKKETLSVLVSPMLPSLESSMRSAYESQGGNMKNICVRVILVLFCSLASSAVAFAQSDLGTISGYVKDPSGGTIAGAQITIKNQSGIERQTTTNESGYYSVTNIPPGFYTLTVEASGFQKYESINNKLDPSAHLGIDATLTVGSATQTVEVTATTVPLQTESAAVQRLITRQQIDMLELNGRNPVGLAGLVPGARGGSAAIASPFLNQGPANFNGSRNQENLITFDGAPATRTRSNGASIGAADVDSTQEVQILTANYSPEYGRTSGAQIRIISRTGTQQFHGALYEYIRNDALNANTWTRNSNPATQFAPPLHYNQFGYNIGGPIYIPDKFNSNKSRLFFYWGQEWVRYHWQESGSSVGSAGLLSVPTLKMRQGDFSELLGSNAFYSTPKFIRDPQKAGTCDATDKTACFPGNVIPAGRLSPNGLGILNAWPVPNLTNFIGGNGNWFAARLHTQHQRKDTLAVDMNLTASQRLAFRRQNYTYLEYQPLDGNTDRTPKFFDRPNQTNSLNHVWIISPTKVNEILLTASLDIVRIPVDVAHFFDRTKACSLPCRLDYPYIFTDGKLIPNRIPTVKVSNFSDLNGGPYPSSSSGPIYDLSDSFTWTKGNHTIKFGALFERAGENDNDEINVQACATCTANQNGQFLFTDSRGNPASSQPTTGVAAANAALGLFDTYSEIGHRAYTLFRGHMWEGFAQDSWKASQKLHIDYGVRYTVIVPYHATWGNMTVFDPRFYDPNKAVSIDPKTGLIQGAIDKKTGLVVGSGKDLYNGMVIPGSGFPSSAKGRVPEADPSQFDFSRLFRGVPDHYSDIQWGNIQPRIGIAYRLGDKNVIRAGVGRFITRLGVSDSVFLGGNPPFQPNASVSFGAVDNPGAGGASNIPLVVTTQSKAFKNPEAWNWNITFERELFWKTLLSVAYVGRRGLHLQREANINQPPLSALTDPANFYIDPADGKSKLKNINAWRPYLGFGSIRQTDNVASSRYNALQLNWTRRWSNGLAFNLAYTFSKSMDDGSGPRDVVPNTYDTRMLWGPSEFDTRHIFALGYIYGLPFFRDASKFSGKLLGGWQISGITQFQTGLPCGVAESKDYAGVGLDANYGCGVGGQYLTLNGDPKIIGTFGSNGQWFRTCLIDVPAGTPCPDGTRGTTDQRIFRPPTAGTFNTQRVRDLIYQPGFQNWNLGLFKSFAFTESKGLQFRAEAFNFINHPNWGGPSGGGVNFNPTNSNFGKVTTKGGNVGQGERNLQLSLRLYF